MRNLQNPERCYHSLFFIMNMMIVMMMGRRMKERKTYKILDVAITASIQKSLHSFKSPRRGCHVKNCLTVLRILEY